MDSGLKYTWIMAQNILQKQPRKHQHKKVKYSPPDMSVMTFQPDRAAFHLLKT